MVCFIRIPEMRSPILKEKADSEPTEVAVMILYGPVSQRALQGGLGVRGHV